MSDTYNYITILTNDLIISPWTLLGHASPSPRANDNKKPRIWQERYSTNASLNCFL